MRDKLENFVKVHLNEFDTKVPSPNVWTLIEKELDAISKKDSLEQFIVTHREDFNNQLPSSEIWSKIDQQLPSSPKVRKLNVFKLAGIAASVVFLMLTSAMAGIYFYGEKKSSITVHEPVTIGEEVPSEFVELEKVYKKRVNRKRVQLASYNSNTGDKDVISTVNEDLSQVDKILKELRSEFKNAPKGSEERIIRAMAKNYETKLQILEIVLDRIKVTESKNEEEDDEGISM